VIADLLSQARSGDREAFQRLAEPHRAELQLHCYRMLGSFHDAEDLVQETLLRAWRAIAQFEERASFRSWLYRIATNACLNALESSKRQRILPDTSGAPFDTKPNVGGALDLPWIEPYPDRALTGVPDSAPGPDARYETREAVQLAFIAAIQLLPPRQRAVLLLRDVLGWSANEAASLLDSSVASVNGALQRARALLDQRLHSGRRRVKNEPNERQRELLERYVHAWEQADVAGFVALLREDVLFTMPPWPHWYRGRDSVGEFLAWACRSEGSGLFRLVPTGANGQPAFAFYRRVDPTLWRAHSIQVLELDGDEVATMTSFVSPELFPSFGLPLDVRGTGD